MLEFIGLTAIPVDEIRREPLPQLNKIEKINDGVSMISSIHDINLIWDSILGDENEDF